MASINTHGRKTLAYSYSWKLITFWCSLSHLLLCLQTELFIPLEPMQCFGVYWIQCVCSTACKQDLSWIRTLLYNIHIHVHVSPFFRARYFGTGYLMALDIPDHLYVLPFFLMNMVWLPEPSVIKLSWRRAQYHPTFVTKNTRLAHKSHSHVLFVLI